MFEKSKIGITSTFGITSVSLFQSTCPKSTIPIIQQQNEKSRFYKTISLTFLVFKRPSFLYESVVNFGTSSAAKPIYKLDKQVADKKQCFAFLASECKCIQNAVKHMINRNEFKHKWIRHQSCDCFKISIILCIRSNHVNLMRKY